MYIKYSGNTYKCGCKPRRDSIVYSGLGEDFPAPVSGDIALYADDGFLMRTDRVEDYLRQEYSDGVLLLTNMPLPEESDEPADIDEDGAPVTWNELAAAYTKGVNSIDE